MNTKIIKHDREGWIANTAEDIQIHGVTARLRVTTSKNHNKHLTTYATIGWPRDDGRFTSVLHRLGFGAGEGDFSKLLQRDTAVRCTEKTVTAQHAKATAVWDTLKQLAADFYPTVESLPAEFRPTVEA
jgi:hypothetical protein